MIFKHSLIPQYSAAAPPVFAEGERMHCLGFPTAAAVAACLVAFCLLPTSSGFPRPADFTPRLQAPFINGILSSSSRKNPSKCVSTRFRRRIPVLLYQEDGGDEQKDAEGRAQNIFPDEGDVGVEEDYSVMTRLREEAESPFRSLRFLIYGGVGASGAIGALTALTGALAAFSGVRGAVPLSESGKDIAIDLGAIGLAALLWNLDSQTKARKLGRLSRGAKIASLKVQVQDGGGAGERPVLSLADLRRDRGRARRVVIFAGGEDVVQAALNAAGEAGMKERLVRNAFLVVPLVLPADGEDNPSVLGLAQERLQGAQDEPHVGWPLLLREWQDYLAAEAAAARKQGIDPVQQGISVVLKLNGRVGQRAFGKPAWERLVGDVERRRRRGLDVTNI